MNFCLYPIALSVALVVNINIIKYFTTVSSMVNLILLFPVIFSLFLRDTRRMLLKFILNNKLLSSMVFFILLYSCSSFLPNISGYHMENWIKFASSIAVAIRVSVFSKKQLDACLNYILWINFIYSLVILINPTMIRGVMASLIGVNYLTITLTLGLSLSVLAVKLAYEKSCKQKIAHIAMLFPMLIAMLYFPSRGSALFFGVILIVSLLASVFKEKINIRKVLGAVFILATFGVTAYYTISDYFLSRFDNLFYNMEDQSRWELYETYLLNLRDSVFSGIGFGRSYILLESDLPGFYPHNFLLQIFGELGLVGLIPVLVIICHIVAAYCKNIGKVSDKTTYYSILAGFIYLIMIFSKSFSMTEAYILLAFSGFMVSLNNIAPSGGYYDISADIKMENRTWRKMKHAF
ncbi:MAG: O-antigen ligase family protein [Clostridia bacterium]|nr:O-antigen ligase family protein [Clostridia bacterium]